LSGLERKPKNWNKECKIQKVHNPNYKSHLIKLPARIGIIGSSGSGKTTTMIEIIHRMSGTFCEIIIVCKSKNQPLYQLLEEKCGDGVQFFENECPDIELFNDKQPRLVIFDDIICDKKMQDPIGKFFVRGRHYLLTVCYLSQNFYSVPKLIRQQWNYIILKKVGSDKDCKLIVKEFGLELSANELVKLYKECTKEKGDFLMVDLEDDQFKWRYNFSPIQLLSDAS
jgi:ABC-type dipeptide/oligopeptide/nickel transport system ATPase component